MPEKLLFGSAISANLPSSILDSSEIRQIPDNQEVFTHQQSDQSIIFEILEYVDKSEQEALQVHFDALASSNGAAEGDSRIIHWEEISRDKLSMAECEHTLYMVGEQKVAKYNETAKNVIEIHLGLFRLPSFETDILVSFNNPVNIDPGSSSYKALPTSADSWMEDDFKEVLASLKILDIGIFGPVS
ncbi:hypothetical protein ScPMuIL_009365 [Solemya velum]